MAQYKCYLALPRPLLQEMPLEWQYQVTDLIRIIGEYCEPHDGYQVWLRAKQGYQKMDDPLANYRYPDRELLRRIQG